MECMQFLHNYGKILFFDRTEDESLLIILDANWLFRVMCSLYSSNNIGRDGFALMTEMEASWNHFSPTVFPILLELMKKFSLAFVCSDAVEILVKTRCAWPSLPCLALLGLHFLIWLCFSFVFFCFLFPLLGYQAKCLHPFATRRPSQTIRTACLSHRCSRRYARLECTDH